MSKDGEDLEVPPPRVEDSGDKNSPKQGTPKGSRVEELSYELMQLNLQRKRLKVMKSQQLTSSSSSNEESDASSKEEAKGKRGRKGDKRYYNTTSFNYDNLSPPSAFTSIPVGKAPHFNGMKYTKWKYVMIMHLISLNPSVWIIVYTVVDFSKDDEEPGYEKLEQIHLNAQATSVLLSSLEKDEFDRVNGLQKAKEI
jgi:hypothetical protein